MIRSTLALLFAIPLFLAALPGHAQPGRPNTGLPTTRLTIGAHVVTAEIASTDETRQIGLMHRFSLAPDHGMLFVHDAPRMLSFWMRNTYIPLSIAFIDAKGRIINIEDMAPHDERTKWSTAPALYALEMKKGWFAERGIGPGAEVKGLPAAVPR
jgi:hypothetical protein